MRILLLTTHYLDDPTFVAVLGGLERAYRNLGHHVVVAGQSPPGWLNSSDRVSSREWSPHIRRLGGKTASSYLGRVLLTFFQLLSLLRDVQLVHLQFTGKWSLLLLASWVACNLRRVPIGVTFLDYNNPSSSSSPDRGWKLALLGRFISKCNWVTAVSRSIANEISLALPTAAKRIRIIPNGFDPREMEAGHVVSTLGKEDAEFVLCAARLREYKGIDVLLMAWKDVCSEFDGVNLVLCGQDRRHGYYQRLAALLGLAARVEFLGEVERERMWNLTHSCLFSVLPSRWESFGIAALEAMACGKAVVATRVGGLPEFIEDGVSGILVPPKDVDALCEAILMLLRQPRLRLAVGEKARSASLRYQWDIIAKSYLSN